MAAISAAPGKKVAKTSAGTCVNENVWPCRFSVSTISLKLMKSPTSGNHSPRPADPAARRRRRRCCRARECRPCVCNARSDRAAAPSPGIRPPAFAGQDCQQVLVEERRNHEGMIRKPRVLDYPIDLGLSGKVRNVEL